MSLRLRSIRQRILLLVLVPVLSLIGLYAFATSITASNAINLARAGDHAAASALATSGVLSGQIEARIRGRARSVAEQDEIAASVGCALSRVRTGMPATVA